MHEKEKEKIYNCQDFTTEISRIWKIKQVKVVTCSDWYPWSLYRKNWQLARKTSYNNKSRTVTKDSFVRNCKDSAKSLSHVRRKNLQKEKKKFLCVEKQQTKGPLVMSNDLPFW